MLQARYSLEKQRIAPYSLTNDGYKSTFYQGDVDNSAHYISALSLRIIRSPWRLNL